MDFKEENTALFDDYLSGIISDKDKQTFESRLKEDPSFKSEFNNYKSFTATIEKAFDHELLQNIKKGETDYQKQKLISGMILFAGLLITCLVGIALWKNFNTEETPVTPLNKGDVSEKKETIKDTLTQSTVVLENIDTILETPNEKNTLPKNTVKTQTSSTPEVKIKTVPVIDFTPIKTLDFSISGNKVFIKSPEKISQVISFKRDHKEYISIHGIVYQKQNNTFVKAKNPRVIEGISRSSGKGKKTEFVITYFERKAKTPREVTEDLKHLVKNDTLYTLGNKPIPFSTTSKFGNEDKYSVSQSYFTVEDIMNLQGNN